MKWMLKIVLFVFIVEKLEFRNGEVILQEAIPATNFKACKLQSFKALFYWSDVRKSIAQLNFSLCSYVSLLDRL